MPGAKDLGLRTALEVFADRAYEEDGSLVNRRKEGAMITDEELAVSRVVRMVKEKRLRQLPERIFLFRQILCAFTETGPRPLRLWKKSAEL